VRTRLKNLFRSIFVQACRLFLNLEAKQAASPSKLFMMTIKGAAKLPELVTIDAKPYAFSFPPKHTAVLVIDMQRDFLLAKGFGDIQGGNLEAVQESIAHVKTVLDVSRAAGLTIFHTREGHKPDLSDCPSSKLIRQAAAPENTQHTKVIGDQGPLGRILTRGEYGHDIVDELAPLPGEVVIDKPGKGTFWNTEIMHKLKAHSITHIFVCGVTTECCWSTSIREANDRGFECCGLDEATAGYNAEFKTSSMAMIYWSQGLFGFVSKLQPLVDTLDPYIKAPSLGPAGVTPPGTPPVWDGDVRIESLQAAYKAGLSPVTVISTLYKNIEAYGSENTGIWIHLVPQDDVLKAAEDLVTKYPDKSKLPPLYGVPFNIKDSLDVSGLPTTTACPPLAFVATTSSPVYDKCIAEGALFLGKVNLDQLATGLNGCRSPYGRPHSVFHKDYISGGSSSGSCVSVGANLSSFSIATDTAGSGRVPSGFNGVVGYKPTRGLLSTVGLTPACLSLDCIAIVAQTVSDARQVWRLCESYDPRDRYAKWPLGFERHVNATGPQAKSFKFGIPTPQALSACSPVYRAKFYEVVKKLQAIGGTLKPIDWTPFDKAGRLLYDGTFVSERLAGLPDDWLDKNKEHLHPVIRELFEAVEARNSTAVQAYRDIQAKALYTRQAEEVFGYSETGVDVVIVPTAPTHWKTEELLADPIKKNSALGVSVQSNTGL
jgi:Asp-tRNA(Asn)/Glu-tRNA(Gln) amidotransferase A subunit family amidase/nicotinamidase-related amidase